MTSELLGRTTELSLFDDLCEPLPDRGAALVIGGEPGVGKTALCDEFARRARSRDVIVLRAAASVAESAAPFAGLHLLLQPLAGGIAGLPTPQRTALDVAFGVVDGPPPSPFLIGLAVVSLLSDAARERPVLVLAEDLHWFDTASRTALFVAARRAVFAPVLMVMTHRTGPDGFDAADVGVDQLRLAPLNFIDANALLDTRPDRPTGSARRTLLELAAGNPLALVELSPRSPVESGVVPLTRRLESAFAGRYASLDQPAQMMMLALALVGEGDVDDAIAAAGRAAGTDGDELSRWIAAGIEAGLLGDVPSRIVFRHPLVRSAVVSATAPNTRHTMLRALTAAVDDSRRSVWWRAELALGVDADLADELDRAGVAAESTGDIASASAAFARAAELSGAGPQRAERRVRAADAAIRAGEYRLAALLLDAVVGQSESPAAQSKARWLRELLPTEPHVRCRVASWRRHSPRSRTCQPPATPTGPWTHCSTWHRSRGTMRPGWTAGGPSPTLSEPSTSTATIRACCFWSRSPTRWPRRPTSSPGFSVERVPMSRPRTPGTWAMH